MASRASLLAPAPSGVRCDSGLFATTSGPGGAPLGACLVSRPPHCLYQHFGAFGKRRTCRSTGLSSAGHAAMTSVAVGATSKSPQPLSSLAHVSPPVQLLPAPVEAAFLPVGRSSQGLQQTQQQTPACSSASPPSSPAAPLTHLPLPPRCVVLADTPDRPGKAATGNAASLDTVDSPPDEALFTLGWPAFDRSRYRAQGVLGSGGYGTVYLALDEVSGDLVAVKRIPKTRKNSAPEKVRRNLLKEAELLSRMQFCTSVVRLYDKFEDERNAYLVMQHLEGGSLEDYVQKNRRQLAEDDVAAVCMVVLQFLAEAHAAGVVFADVKPSNFMLTGGSGGEPLSLQVIDFGCSQEVPLEGQHLTQRCGTYKYFAPEVFHQRYGTKADIWSAGIMMYRILTNNYPWWKAGAPITPAAAMDEICDDEPIPFPQEAWKHWSDEAADFVAFLLQRDPVKRPSAVEAMAHPWLTKHLASYHAQQAMAKAPQPSANNIVPLSACRTKAWIKRDNEGASMNCAAL